MIIGGADVKENARMFLGLISEIALVPDGAFIVEERFALRVPVAGHFQFGSCGEVVFGGKGIVGLSFAIQKPAIGLDLVMKTEEAVEVWIDDGGPFAVERSGWAAISAGKDDGRGRGCCRGGCGNENRCAKEQLSKSAK